MTQETGRYAHTLCQPMLQCGSPCAIAHGVGREESCVALDNEGDPLVECLVEPGVLLPSGQGNQIPQAVQRVISADSRLGKRKAADDLRNVEIRLKTLQCDKLQIEKKQMKKQFDIENATKIINNNQKIMHNEFVNINSFVHAMAQIDPLWRNDKRVVLQVTDFLKNHIFDRSCAQQTEIGPEGSE